MIVVSKSSFEKYGAKPTHLLRASLLFSGFVFLSLTPDTANAVPGRSTFQLRGAQTQAQSTSARNASEDPLAFLEGSPSCDVVISGVERRYKKDGTGVRALPANLLLEEFRHVALETCSSDKFSSCDFHWCRSKKNTMVAKATTQSETAVAAKKIEVAAIKAEPVKPAISEVEAIETSRARLSVPEKVPAEKLIASTKTSNSIVAEEDFTDEPLEQEVAVAPKSLKPQEPKLVEPVKEDSIVAEAAPVREMPIAPVAAKKSDIAPLKSPELSPQEVQAKLAELIREKNQRQLAMIESKRAEENKYGVIWRAVTVPGSKPHPKDSRGEEQAPEGKGGQFMRTKTSQTSTSLEDHVAADTGEEQLNAQDAAKARVNNQSLSNGQDAYFRMLRSRNPQTRGGARGRGGFPQLNMGDSER